MSDRLIKVKDISGPIWSAKSVLRQMLDKITKRLMWTDLKTKIHQVDILLDTLQRREPTRDEMTCALGDADEVFYDGWTVRKCVDCGEPVAGGPTRCMICVTKLETTQYEKTGG